MGNLSLSLTWEGRTVRMAGTSECPEWVAVDVCQVLALTGTHPWQRLPAAEKGSTLMATPGGEQRLTTVKLPGLLRLILRSDKPEAQRFQDWTVREVLPSVLRYGCYPPPQEKESPGRVALALAHAVVALEERQAATESIVLRLESAEAERAKREEESSRVIAELPAASCEVDQATYGSLTEKRIRAHAFLGGREYSKAYREFYDAADVRLHVRLSPERRESKRLREAIDSYPLAKAQQIYALACELFPAGKRRAA